MTRTNLQKTRSRQKNRHSDIDDLVRRRIERLISESPDDDYASISSLLGKNHAYIQQYIKRRTPQNLREEDRRLIAEHFNVPPDTLYVGPRSSVSRPETGQNSPGGWAQSSDDIIRLPVLSNPVADRTGLLDNRPGHPDPAADAPAMGFSRSVLGEIAGHGDPNTLMLTRVQGSAMAPTLGDGDMMLILANRQRPLRDGIFAIYIDGMIVPKRITVHPDGKTVTLSNDNSLYGQGFVCHLDEMELLGPIIWCGRRL